MKIKRVDADVVISMIKDIQLQDEYPEELEHTVGVTFVGIAENAAELITNVHELVQFQKVLNMSIDEHPLIRDKSTAKEIIEKVLYKKED